MRLLSSLLLTPLCVGLDITSPSSGSTIDPSQPFNITWDSSSGDPSTVTFKIEKAQTSTSLGADQVLASNVTSQDGTVSVPAYTIQSYGTGFQLLALASESGDRIAEVDDLVLAQTSGVASSLSNGGWSWIATATAAAAESGTDGQSSQASTDTGTSSTSSTVVVTTAATTHSSSKPTGFTTSTTTSTSSSSSSDSSTSSTTDTNTANRLGLGLAFSTIIRSEAAVMGAAGVLAGAVALLA